MLVPQQPAGSQTQHTGRGGGPAHGGHLPERQRPRERRQRRAYPKRLLLGKLLNALPHGQAQRIAFRLGELPGLLLAQLGAPTFDLLLLTRTAATIEVALQQGFKFGLSQHEGLRGFYCKRRAT